MCRTVIMTPELNKQCTQMMFMIYVITFGLSNK